MCSTIGKLWHDNISHCLHLFPLFGCKRRLKPITNLWGRIRHPSLYWAVANIISRHQLGRVLGIEQISSWIKLIFVAPKSQLSSANLNPGFVAKMKTRLRQVLGRLSSGLTWKYKSKIFWSHPWINLCHFLSPHIHTRPKAPHWRAHVVPTQCHPLHDEATLV